MKRQLHSALRYVETGMSDFEFLCVNLVRENPMRLIIGFAITHPVDLTTRLIARWLTEEFDGQFAVENLDFADRTIASEAFYDKIEHGLARQTGLIGIIGIPKVVRKGMTAHPRSIGHSDDRFDGPHYSPVACFEPAEISRFTNNSKLLRLTFQGRIHACVNLSSGRAEVMLDGLPGAIPFGTRHQLRRPAPGRRMRSIKLLWNEVSAWYGIGICEGSPAEILERLGVASNGGVHAADLDMTLPQLCSLRLSRSKAYQRKISRGATRRQHF